MASREEPALEPLRGKPVDLPAISTRGTCTAVQEAVVQSVRPALPEFDGDGSHQVSTPMGWAWNIVLAKLGLHLPGLIGQQILLTLVSRQRPKR